MTGEVAFMLIVGLAEMFLLWNSTQFSTGKRESGEYLTYITGRNLYCVLMHTCYPCSMCCCMMTKPGPKRMRKTGRKCPTPEQWCNRSSTESLSPGYHSRDLQKLHLHISLSPCMTDFKHSCPLTSWPVFILSFIYGFRLYTCHPYLQTKDLFFSSRLCLPHWCIGQGLFPGRRLERHRWTGRLGTGWGMHLRCERAKDSS